jgi:hypothetical protein
MRNKMALLLLRFAQWMLTKTTRCYEWAVLHEEAKRIERKIRKGQLKVTTQTVKNYDDKEPQ